MLSRLPARLHPICSSPRGLLLAVLGLLLMSVTHVHAANEAKPILTITRGDDSQRLSLEAIETGDLHHVQMRHPEGPEGRFTGVWLNDFLAAHGLEDARRVRFIADDGYTTFLTRAQRQEKAYLLATRLDGAPIGVNRLGPLMLVVPDDAQAVLDGKAPAARWIWALMEISTR